MKTYSHKSLLRLLTVFVTLSMTLILPGCGGDDDEPSSSSSYVRAFSDTYTIGGTRTEFYVSLNSGAGQGKLLMFYNGEYRSESFSYHPDNGFDTQINIEGSKFTLMDNGTSITITNNYDESYRLWEVNVKDYWQNKYDTAAENCENSYNQYITGSIRYPEIALAGAQNYQKYMRLYRQWAEADGATLTTSPWETKDLSAGTPGGGGSDPEPDREAVNTLRIAIRKIYDKNFVRTSNITCYKEDNNGTVYLYLTAKTKSCIGDVAASRNYATTKEGQNVSSYSYVVEEKGVVEEWSYFYYFN